MKLALLLVCGQLLAFVTSGVIRSDDVTVVKRSDDAPPLESVVQQQAMTIQTLQTKLAAMESKFASFETRLQKEEQNKQVAFHVRFSGGWSTHHIGDDGTLKFDGVITNLGNAYSPETGIFTAPFSGTYLFIIGAMTAGPYGELCLMKTGRAILALTHNQQPTGILHEKDTTQAAVHLQAGEQVWVQTNYGTADYQGYWGTMFTGVLVEAD